MNEPSLTDGPGYFFVLSQPKAPEFEDEYHQWYNEEHGPLRMKLDFFLNGYRYKSLGHDPPIYLACYDLASVSVRAKPEYKVLRERRSAREAHVINTKLSKLDRRIYADISTRGSADGPAPVVMPVAFVVKDEFVDELNRWYEEEHTEDISKIPGWRRTRRFQLVEGDELRSGYTQLLAVHDFDKDNGLDGPEHEHAKSKPWRMKVVEMVESRENDRFEFLHEFRAEDYRPAALTNGHVVNSHVVNGDAATASTGATSWLLEGPEDGPVVAFSNSLLTDIHLWDTTIKQLKKLYPQMRFLRYNTRGYEKASKEKVTVDLLADDLAALLDQLGIRKCFAVVGVSLGGITALNFALRYPGRLDCFVSCDCNDQSSPMNTQAWQDRIALSRTEGGWNLLAEQTVHRWFAPSSIEHGLPAVSEVHQMILAGSRDGFENCVVGALCDFDLSRRLKEVTVPGCCAVGSQDGVLPKTMRLFSKNMRDAYFAEIAGTGHLPMMEDAEAFVQAIRPLFDQHLK